MTFAEYDDLDAIGLAELVAKGDVSPTEVLDACIERAQARNPALNAIVVELFDRARSRVEELPDGPLRGVPMLLKDLKLALEGTVTSDGSVLSRSRVMRRSSVTAQRYEDAGLQIVGKSNTPEFGIMAITEPKLYGPCRNPWNTEHTPGGSSGGSAAAVAARIVPVAHSGDGGGSIRIPAAHCGLVGLKPTRGRVTQAPFKGESWCGFVQEHVVSRSVRDSALLLDIEAQPTPGEPYAAPHQEGSWLDASKRDPGKLKIAFWKGTLFAGDTHPDCADAVDAGVEALTELGHEVVEAHPTFPREELIDAYYTVVSSGVAVFVRALGAEIGRKLGPGDVEPSTWMFACIGERRSSADLIEAQNVIQKAGREVAGFFEDYDAFVTSTAAIPPARVGELYPSGWKDIGLRILGWMPNKFLLDLVLSTLATKTLAATPNTMLFNQTGQPGISLPLHWNEAGLPVGTQIVGKFGGEATLLQLATQLEQARPWAGRKPPGI